jgi:hypothetical protein
MQEKLSRWCKIFSSEGAVRKYLAKLLTLFSHHFSSGTTSTADSAGKSGQQYKHLTVINP